MSLYLEARLAVSCFLEKNGITHIMRCTAQRTNHRREQ